MLFDSSPLLELARRLIGVLLVAFLAGTALLLCGFELLDTDVWWHLRGGEWILHNGRVPNLDPFSFGSATERWIDLHWLFQVVLAICHRAGGIPGVLLLTGSLAAGTVVVGILARREGTPLVVTLLVWLPAVVLASNRFDPRPEMVTLLLLAGFLTVLGHLDRNPRLVWILPGLQLLWVNMHGLFILGPIVLGFWWLDQAAQRLARRFGGATVEATCPCLRHPSWASLTVVLVCLLNPYGLEGVLFPLQLYPKVAQEANIYKEYIEEFMSPRKYALWAPANAAAGRWYLGMFQFVLLLLPLSFLLPAVWPAPRSSAVKSGAVSREIVSSTCGLFVFAALVVLLAIRAISGNVMSGLLSAVGQVVPWLLLGGGVAGAAALRKRPIASALSVMGGIALAAWAVWLGEYLPAPGTAAEQPSTTALIVAALAGLLSAALLIRQGGSVFALLLAGAFAYLALQAVNSFSRLGLIAGVVLSWNLGPWIGGLIEALPPPWKSERIAWGMRLGLLGLLVGWATAVATENYSRWIGDPRRLTLGERPLTFAHDAARFAGQEGLPECALVYDIGQACVFVYHNAPEHRVYMDARLEVPTEETFRTYARIERLLNEESAAGIAAVDHLGKPLVLLSHEGNHQAEAALFAHPDWRCLYFDALASVFVPRDDSGMERNFPTFAPAEMLSGSPVPPEPGAAWKEAKALFNVSVPLRRLAPSGYKDRLPFLLAALRRCEQAIEEEPARAGIWTVRGQCFWGLSEGAGTPPVAGSEWVPSSLPWAQATRSQLRALDLDPENTQALLALFRLYGARRMLDAQRAIGERLLAKGGLPAREEQAIRRLVREVPSPRNIPGRLPPNVSDLVRKLLESNRIVEATGLAERALEEGERRWAWPTAERLAGAWMHLGRPERARAVWQSAKSPPAEGMRLERLASTFWVENDTAEAVRLYRQACAANVEQGEPWAELAWLHAQQGNPQAALEACAEARRRSLPPAMARPLGDLEQTLRPTRSTRDARSGVK